MNRCLLRASFFAESRQSQPTLWRLALVQSRVAGQVLERPLCLHMKGSLQARGAGSGGGAPAFDTTGLVKVIHQSLHEGTLTSRHSTSSKTSLSMLSSCGGSPHPFGPTTATFSPWRRVKLMFFRISSRGRSRANPPPLSSSRTQTTFTLAQSSLLCAFSGKATFKFSTC